MPLFIQKISLLLQGQSLPLKPKHGALGEAFQDSRLAALFQKPGAPWLASLLSACLLTASHPPLDLGPLVLIAFVPWLLSLLFCQRLWSVFASGFLIGLFFYGVNIFYLSQMEADHDARPWMYGMWLVVSALSALYFGVFALCSRWLIRRFQPFLWLFLLPGLWAGLEFWRYWIPAPFPYLFQGYALHQIPALIQSADLGGVHLVSFFVLFTNVAFFLACYFGMQGQTKKQKLSLISLVVIFALQISYGSIRMASIGAKIKHEGPIAAIVQPNIPQKIKERDDSAWLRWEKHMQLMQQLSKGEAEIILWSETAYPWPLPSDYGKRSLWRGHDPKQLARELQTPMVFGAVTYPGPEDRPHYPHIKQQEWEKTSYSSAWYLDSKGHVQGRFDKIFLVPGGEYLPYRGTFIGDLVADYAFSLAGYVPQVIPGYRYDTFQFEDRHKRPFRFSLNICYEFAFPELFRELHNKVDQENVHFAFNLSNEGWYFDSAELDQALIMSQFRAIESRTSFVRATNTGISAIIDPLGQTVHTLQDQDGNDRMIEGVLMKPLPYLEQSTASFFHRYGFWWARGMGLFAFVLVLSSLLEPFCARILKKRKYKACNQDNDET